MTQVVTPTFHNEVMLAGWKETSTGGATVTFWLPDPDMLGVFRGLTQRKGNKAGHRFACVLVEIDDDETPKQEEEKSLAGDAEATPDKAAEESAKPAATKRHLPEGLCGLAIRWCAEPSFYDWLLANFADDCADAYRPEIKAPQLCATVLKRLCRIATRKQLDTDAVARSWFNNNIRGPYAGHRIRLGLADV